MCANAPNALTAKGVQNAARKVIRMNDSPRWRRIVGALLVVVGCLLVPISLSAVWVRNTLLNTDHYVSTVGPLASNADIQQALAADLSNGIFTRVDVNQKIVDALPERASFLGAPIANAVKTAIDQAALRLVESDRFQTLWENANRRAHAKVVDVLTGGGSRVSTENGTVSINVGQIFDNVKQKLDAKGISIFDSVTIPADEQQFVLFQSQTLADVQGLVDLLQTVAWVLPFLALACFAGAIALSQRRRRTIERAALGVAFAVAVQLILVKAGRNLYLDAITGKKLPKAAAGAVWDQMTSFLRASAITIVVLALLIAAIAWFSGRQKPEGAGDGSTTPGPVATFVAHWTSVLRGIGVAIAFIVLIAWNQPTLLTVLVIGVLLIAYLAAVQAVGRSARSAQTVDAA